MLDNKVIVYDDSCPMCKLYTYWFVAWGFLRPENRIGFTTAPAEVTSHVDLNRARHEIPLYDRETKQALYGLSALTYILGSRWTWLKPVFRSRLFLWTFHPIYQIITYNRRVIAGCKHCGNGFDCAPDLNRFYRTAYFLIAICLIGVVATLLLSTTGDVAKMAATLLVGFGLMSSVTGAIKRITQSSETAWEHLGNHATIGITVAAFITPILWVPETLRWAFLFAAVFIATFELIRRN